jgi:hypothetical protein
VRLSRNRLLLRAALLLVVGAFMTWRGFDTRSAAAALGVAADDALALGRIALLEWLLGALALATAGVALASLRHGGGPTARERPLRLGAHPGPPDEPGRDLDESSGPGQGSHLP